MGYDSVPEFRELLRLRRCLTPIKAHHVAALAHFFAEEEQGFRRTEEHDGPSESSTATCIVSLVSTGMWAYTPWAEKVSELGEALLTGDWSEPKKDKYFPLTAASVLDAAATLGINNQLVEEATKVVEESFKDGAVASKGCYPSAFLTQLAARGLRARNSLPYTLQQEIGQWAKREIERQLALLAAKSPAADLFQLAYSVLLSAQFVDANEKTPDQRRVERTALDRFFDAKTEGEPTWPRSLPLFQSAYCYEYELLAQLLYCRPLREQLIGYLPQLAECAYSLPSNSFILNEGALAWCSGHDQQALGPESWATASVYHFVHNLDQLVAELIRRSLFQHVDLPYRSERPKDKDFAPGFLDCSLEVNGTPVSLKETLYEGFVKPIEEQSREIQEGGAMAKGTLVSGIFFGPPGTSKTDLAKHISNYLGWPLLTVDPAYFMRDGLDKIQIQADRLFQMLNEAERVVVLLDEFDEMVRDRTNSSEVLSRFLTTAMLPKLARIKKSNRIVFLVVTNHIDEFDLAVRRPGRFDMILQIMPPTTTAKLAKWFRVGVALDRWNLANDQSVLEKLERLTFNEFEAAAPALANASSAADLKLKLDEAYRNCTLSDEVETGVDWYEVCRRQRRRIRPPGLNDGWLEPAVSAATEGEIG